MKLLVTGGAGFIGWAVVRHCLTRTEHQIVNLDKLTYAGDPEAARAPNGNLRYQFEQVDICDAGELARVFATHRPDSVMHLAAESHVDRSIDGPAAFVATNLGGTATLLEAARTYWQGLKGPAKDGFRFHHISTDEVYGDLGPEDAAFSEETPYAPNSPYSASKAGSDHLVRAWGRTYGLPVLVTNCSNNYGPHQFPEKFIPTIILSALAGRPIPVYGAGRNVRDWLYVEDHVEGLLRVIEAGTPGETYNLGGNSERANIDVVGAVCAELERQLPDKPADVANYADLISFVADRTGHDRRYAVDAGKIGRTLGWAPRETFESGLAKTVAWYLDNEEWWRRIQQESYAGQRLGQALSA